MLFAPTNIIPSNQSGLGAGTIDATENLTIRWQVNGNSPMTAYRIVIMQNNAASTPKFDTGKVTLNVPFNGKNYAGVIQTFSANTISAAELAAANIVNGYANGYKLSITQWWNANDSITQPSAAYFVARDTPILTINAIPEPLATKSHSFTATYTQSDGDTLNWVRWYLALSNDKDNPIVDTGNISGTEELRLDYDGFFSGNQYAIRCVIQTENGIEVDTGYVDFGVQYITQEVGGMINACKANDRNALYVSWSNIFAINGTATGAYEVADGKLLLPANSSVIWNNVNGYAMSFSSPWTIVWKGFIENAGGDMFSATINGQALTLSITKTNGVVLSCGGASLYTQAISNGVYGWWTVILTPNHIYVQRIVVSGGLYPHAGLYPRTGLRPQESTAASIVTYDADYTFTSGTISAISVYGRQTCEYIWCKRGVMAGSEIAAILASYDFEPTWDNGTNMLADFSHGIDAGSLATTGYSVYRLTKGASVLMHLIDLDVSVQDFYDYSVASQQTYTYYVFAAGTGTFITAPLVSAPTHYESWDNAILECTIDENGIYHVEAEYKFKLNLETGAVSNNNNPTIYKNFTRYPTRQGVSSNYRTGTLSAIIGIVNQYENKYIEPITLADAIYALSVSDKPKFLKDRKGNIRRIETNGDISMQVGDNYRAQPSKMTFPWIEVDSAEGLSVITIAGDGAYPVDAIVDTEVDIEVENGDLTWSIPKPYINGSELILIQSSSGGYVPATLTIDENGNLVATT